MNNLRTCRNALKNTRKFVMIAFTVAAVFSTVACTGSGGKALNSAESLKAYIDSQPASTPDKPIRVSMNADDLMFKSIADVIKAADKYVSLDLSKGLITTIPNDAFYDTKTYKGSVALVGIVLPNSVTSIGTWAFRGCTSLASVTIPNIRKTARFT